MGGWQIFVLIRKTHIPLRPLECSNKSGTTDKHRQAAKHLHKFMAARLRAISCKSWRLLSDFAANRLTLLFGDLARTLL